MKRKKVLVVIPMIEAQRQALITIGEDCEFAFCDPEDVTEVSIREAEVILGNLNPTLIQAAQQLEWLQLNSAGYEQYLEPGVLAQEVLLTNAGGAYGPAVAEHLIAMVFSVAKKLPLYRDSQSRGEWADYGQVLPLHGQNVLVVGLGDIGQHFASMMKALGNHVIGVRRNTGDKPDFVDEIHALNELNQLLPKADVVALCIPLTAQTRKLMGRDQFEMMKKTALFFNIGRGELVDTQALYDAIKQDKIGGAGIDVTDPEPLPAEHPLWKLPNLLITPHCSGGFHLQETLERIVAIVLRNFERYIKREELENRIRR
ncbi:MAG: D-2-hydroxyacid dehydrogenase [Herbinix sp.]|nr:D-2-hydroxyacid dehydrogenase [Herbinix sp.]